MKKLLFLVAMPLFVVACNNITSSDTKEWEDKAKGFASDVAEKSVELYEVAAPVVEEAAYDVAEKSVELYEVAAPVVEEAAYDVAEKSVEFYEEAAPVVEEAAYDAADKSVEIYNDLRD